MITDNLNSEVYDVHIYTDGAAKGNLEKEYGVVMEWVGKTIKGIL
jgi:hypothetical protein